MREVIADRDPGDECDADGAVARTVAFLIEMMSRQLRPFVTPTREQAIYRPGPWPCLALECVLVAVTDGHDFGDEDRKQEIRWIDIAVELAA